MSRTGILGGTFNPPHLAHKRLAFEAAKAAKLDRIIVIPTFVPPHKQAKALQKGDDRLEMCRLTFSEDIFFVSDMELQRQGKSYSFDTLCELHELYPDDEFYLIIGSDMLLSFDSWYRYSDLLSMCTLCAASRQGADEKQKLRTYAEERLGLSEKNGSIIILSADAFELSSTQIRQMIENGEELSGVLEKNTLEYINERGLYK